MSCNKTANKLMRNSTLTVFTELRDSRGGNNESHIVFHCGFCESGSVCFFVYCWRLRILEREYYVIPRAVWWLYDGTDNGTISFLFFLRISLHSCTGSMSPRLRTTDVTVDSNTPILPESFSLPADCSIFFLDPRLGRFYGGSWNAWHLSFFNFDFHRFIRLLKYTSTMVQCYFLSPKTVSFPNYGHRFVIRADWRDGFFFFWGGGERDFNTSEKKSNKKHRSDLCNTGDRSVFRIIRLHYHGIIVLVIIVTVIVARIPKTRRRMRAKTFSRRTVSRLNC